MKIVAFFSIGVTILCGIVECKRAGGYEKGPGNPGSDKKIFGGEPNYPMRGNNGFVCKDLLPEFCFTNMYQLDCELKDKDVCQMTCGICTGTNKKKVCRDLNSDCAKVGWKSLDCAGDDRDVCLKSCGICAPLGGSGGGKDNSGDLTFQINGLRLAIDIKTGLNVILIGGTNEAKLNHLNTTLNEFKKKKENERETKRSKNFNACKNELSHDECQERWNSHRDFCGTEIGQRECQIFCGVCDPHVCKDRETEGCGRKAYLSCNNEEVRKRTCRMTCRTCEPFDETAYWKLIGHINRFQSRIGQIKREFGLQGSSATGQAGSRFRPRKTRHGSKGPQDRAVHLELSQSRNLVQAGSQE